MKETVEIENGGRSGKNTEIQSRKEEERRVVEGKIVQPVLSTPTLQHRVAVVLGLLRFQL